MKTFFIQMTVLSMMLCVFFGCSNSNQKLIPARDTNTGKYGFVNEKGKEVIPFIYDNVLDYYLYDFARVELDGKIGCIDKLGQIVVPIKYDSIGRIIDLICVKLDGKYGYINQEGTEIIPIIYDNTGEIGSAMWVKLNEKYGFINRKEENKKNISIKYDGFDKIDYHKNLIQVNIGVKYGYVDMDGTEVVPVKYDEIGDFNYIDAFGTLAAIATLNGKRGYVDKTGKEIIPIEYDIVVFRGRDNIGKASLNGKYDYVDKTGKEIIPIKYDYIGEFEKNNLAKASLDNKFGYINKEGKEVVPLKYDDIGNIYDGLMLVKLNGKYGYINQEGKEITSIKYDMAEGFFQGSARVGLGEELGTIDVNGKFTSQGKKITLLEAIKKKYVNFSSYGMGIEWSHIRIENLTDMKLHLIIPAGTYLIANSSSYQSMLIISNADIILNARQTYSNSICTACMNMYRAIPKGNNTFGIAQLPNNHLLTKLIKVIDDEGSFLPTAVQAAVWIVTDNANYSSMGTLRRNGERVIDKEDYNQGLSLVNKAKKMK